MKNQNPPAVRLTRERRLVPEGAICYVGPATMVEQDGHQFMVIAESVEALEHAWTSLGAVNDLNLENVKKLAAFEYKATK